MSKESIVVSMELHDVDIDSKSTIVRDDDGYYDVPVGILDATGRNKTSYTLESFKRVAMTPGTSFHSNLTNGFLYGEAEHPDKKAPIPRIVKIERARVSHFIKSIELVNSSEGTLIMAKIKPHGKFGNDLEANLNDPYMNTAFSLRALSKYVSKGDVRVGHFMHFITFDWVCSPGFFQASKNYNRAMESVTYEVSKEDFIFHTLPELGNVANEALFDDQILDCFDLEVITVGGTRCFLDREKQIIIDPREQNGDRKKSIFHTAMTNRR